jgi:hypothetical protein
MFPLSISEGAAFQKHSFHAPAEAHIEAPSHSEQHDSKDKTWALDWSYDDDSYHHNRLHADDDNKSHYFHYERFWRSRYRVLLSVLFKILLAIIHICSLVCATVHLLH